MVKAAVLVSGGGTNLQALLDACASGTVKSAEISLVVSSKAGVYALERAKAANVKTIVVPKKDFKDKASYDEALLKVLKKNSIDIIVLGGFLCILGERLISEYKDKIINVHPSLIPSFCGEGFYGLAVHEAVLKRGVKLTGATVHLVNEVADGGKILLQKAVAVSDDDTPESLQKRVMQEAEWILLAQALEMLASDNV